MHYHRHDGVISSVTRCPRTRSRALQHFLPGLVLWLYRSLLSANIHGNFCTPPKLLVYKKCPIKSPETATKIGQNCLKLHEITKIKKIAKIATRNLTQFHPISFNFTQFCSKIFNLEYVSSINFARKFPCKKNGLQTSPPRNFNQFQPMSANFHQFVPILSNFPQYYSIFFFVNFREISK